MVLGSKSKVLLRNTLNFERQSLLDLLYGFDDFAAAKAASADAKALWLTVDQGPDWLEIGLEDPFGLVIGVTDVIAGLASFVAEVACKCHGYTPSSGRIKTILRMGECTTGLSVLTSGFEGNIGGSSGMSGLRMGRA